MTTTTDGKASTVQQDSASTTTMARATYDCDLNIPMTTNAWMTSTNYKRFLLTGGRAAPPTARQEYQ